MIWAMPMGLPVETPTGSGNRGFTTAVLWMTRADDTEEGIAYGTDEGYLCIWKRVKAELEVSELYYLIDNHLHEISFMRYSADAWRRSQAGKRFQPWRTTPTPTSWLSVSVRNWSTDF